MKVYQDPNIIRGNEGRLYDSRAKFTRGDRVRINWGYYKGLPATVDCSMKEYIVKGQTVAKRKYRILLDDGQWLAVEWDDVESAMSLPDPIKR